MDTTTAKGISLFATLTDDELQGIVRLARRIPFENDQQIIRQGQQHSSLLLVGDGTLHVSRKAEKNNLFLGRIEKGGFFGEIGLLDFAAWTSASRTLCFGARTFRSKRGPRAPSLRFAFSPDLS